MIPSDIELYFAGRRVIAGSTLAIAIPSIRGLTRAQAFRLDVHNAGAEPIAAGALDLGLVLPAMLSSRSTDAVALPDGRALHLAGGLVPIHPDGWASVRFDHVPRDPKHYRGRRLAAEVRLFAAGASATTGFFLRLAHGPDTTSALVDLRSARARPFPVPLHPSSTPQGKFANRVLGYLGADERFAVYARMRPDAWYPSGEFARAALVRGIPQEKVRQCLEQSWGRAADAIVRAARDTLAEAPVA